MATKTKEQAAARDTLRDIYISISEGMECTDEMLGHIKRLEATLHPRDDGCTLAWRHTRNDEDCWDCIAERGGDAMDV